MAAATCNKYAVVLFAQFCLDIDHLACLTLACMPWSFLKWWRHINLNLLMNKIIKPSAKSSAWLLKHKGKAFAIHELWLKVCACGKVHRYMGLWTLPQLCILVLTSPYLLHYLPFRPDTFEFDSLLILTMLITEIPICRDTTVRFSFLKPVCRRLDLPCLKTCQWCKSLWSKSWSHALLLPSLSLLRCSIPGSVTGRCHFSLLTKMVWAWPF